MHCPYLLAPKATAAVAASHGCWTCAMLPPNGAVQLGLVVSVVHTMASLASRHYGRIHPLTFSFALSITRSQTLVVVCRCAQVEGTLVAAGTLGLLRLCQRLLPCKPEAAELLLRGLQLVPSVDPEVRV